jgi:predicted Holliday junction resolvase-like endonuclease
MIALITGLVALGFFILYILENNKNKKIFKRFKENEKQLIETLQESQKLFQENKTLVEELNHSRATLKEVINVEIPKMIEIERADAIKTSKSIVKGKTVEQLIPFFPDFPYQSADLKGIFAPIDYVIFDGMSRNDIKQIVFMDIKSGSSQLTERQRQIQDCLKNSRLKFETFRVN